MANNEFAKVLNCAVANCSYNQTNACMAAAITMGAPQKEKAACVTFIPLSVKGGQSTLGSFVGACTREDCSYNDHLECSAASVRVGASDAECLTYTPR